MKRQNKKACLAAMLLLPCMVWGQQKMSLDQLLQLTKLKASHSIISHKLANMLHLDHFTIIATDLYTLKSHYISEEGTLLRAGYNVESMTSYCLLLFWRACFISSYFFF